MLELHGDARRDCYACGGSGVVPIGAGYSTDETDDRCSVCFVPVLADSPQRPTPTERIALARGGAAPSGEPIVIDMATVLETELLKLTSLLDEGHTERIVYTNYSDALPGGFVARPENAAGNFAPMSPAQFLSIIEGTDETEAPSGLDPFDSLEPAGYGDDIQIFRTDAAD